MVLGQSSQPENCCGSGFAGCDELASSVPAVIEREILISGDGTYRLSLPRSAGGLLILVAERGNDLLLAVEREGSIDRADSPLPGFGVQRLLLADSGIHADAVISSKASDAPPGKATIRVIALAEQPGGTCMQMHRQLAVADAAYARGWAIGNLPHSGEPGNASEHYEASIERYQDVLATLGRRDVMHAPLLMAVAVAYHHGKGDWVNAQSWGQRAAAAYRALGDQYGALQAQTLRAMALLNVDSAVVPDALATAAGLLRDSAQAHAQRGELRERAEALNNLGIALYYMGDYHAATVAYDEAQQAFEALDQRTSAWQVQDNKGVIDYELGNFERARSTYAALLQQDELRTRPALYLNVLTNSALVQLDSGEAGKALQLYQEALESSRLAQEQFYEALSLQGLGGAYEALGEVETALTFYEGALRLRTREAWPRYRLETLWTMADLHRRQGQAAKALTLDLEALALADSDLDRSRMRLRIAADREALGETAAAHAELAHVLERRVPGDVFIHARGLLLRGRLRAREGRLVEADADLKRAFRTFAESGFARQQFEAQLAIAELRRSEGDEATALDEVDAAIALAERLRLQSANPGLRASLLDTLRPAYDLKISLLARRHAAANSADARQRLAWEALDVTESARARALLEYERMDYDSSAMASLKARRRALYEQLAQSQTRLTASSERLRADDGVLELVRANVAEQRRLIDQIETQLAAEGQAATQPAAGRSAAGNPPQDVVFVHYWLGASRAYAWVVAGADIHLIDLGDTAATLDAAWQAQRTLQDSVRATTETRLEAMRILSERIWHPVRLHVPPRMPVVFIPDMALYYIPFAALLDDASGPRFLVHSHDVATAPSMRLLLAGPATRPAGSRMLVVADPDYGEQLPRLPGTAREADAIAAMMGAGKVDRLQGRQATRERFLGAALADYRYIHIATHALADARVPQLSTLHLAAIDVHGRPADGRVFAADLLDVRLNAELVVLSACDTALGRLVSGEGMIGLRYVVLARGAGAVASSLWRIGDRHSRELMQNFYAPLLEDGKGAPAAMGEAMRAMINAHGADPAVWAGFDIAVRDLRTLRPRSAPMPGIPD